MATNKAVKLSRQQEALIETTRDLEAVGITGKGTTEKQTMRLFGESALPTVPAIWGREIADLRDKVNVSQAVLATHLGVTVGYLSRLERGELSPSRPVARLLDIIRRKGLEAVR